MSEQDQSLLKALSKRLSHLLQQEIDPQAAMRDFAARMYQQELLEIEPKVDAETWPESFAEEVTLQNPVLLSKAPDLRQRQLRPGRCENLNDWLDNVS